MATLKRLEAPRFWPIEKKTKKYTVAALPGPHARGHSLTLAVVLREMLRHAETLREAKEILRSSSVRVDGAERKEPGFPVGLMDVVSVGDENYRVLPGNRGLYLMPIEKKDSGTKLRKITGKTVVRNGAVQLHFHDGTNLLADGRYSTGDVAVFDIGSGKIREVIKQEKGAKVMVIGGKNTGTVGTLEDVRKVSSPEPNVARISAGERKITLPLGYIFAIGSKEPAINVGG